MSLATSPPLLGDHDLHLFNEGSHLRLWEKLGAHLCEVDGVKGVHFAVWAPAARTVSVVGDFNHWEAGDHPLSPNGSSGIWSGFVAGATKGMNYKYHIVSHHHGAILVKSDPHGFYAEQPPKSASRVWDWEYEWGDEKWMRTRGKRQTLESPVSIYELHLGSWRRNPLEANRSLTYLELAKELPDYVEEMGFTHVEIMPIMQHPFEGSWGYQCLGYFAPDSRFGTPDEFMALVDALHQRGIGVILDWVPSHFATDGHGLAKFDGTHLYEHEDPRQGYHPDWGSYIFNYGRCEVRSFLLSNALFWIEKYHIDGLRVDAVASMLYLDYSREDGEWIPNAHGGNENLEAISFLRRFNEELYHAHPDVQTFAEESTSWPMVSRPTYVGGLGFGQKWDMGWMHDTLRYMSLDPVHRRFHHNDLTFRMLYAWHENFTLPLSHDEVVHGKGSLLRKMPGDDWQKFANLRLLLSNMYTQPGKKLLFMGGEFGQWDEWNHAESLPWHLLDYEPHQGIKRCVQDLNRIYRDCSALHSTDAHQNGFEWIDCNDADASIISFARHSQDMHQAVVVIFNYTPVPRHDYRIGVPRPGHWAEVFNSDADIYGGSNIGNVHGATAQSIQQHGRPDSIVVNLPPLGMVMLRHEG